MLWEPVYLFVVTCVVVSTAMLKAVSDEYRTEDTGGARRATATPGAAFRAAYREQRRVRFANDKEKKS